MYQNQTKKTIKGTYMHRNPERELPFDVRPGDSIIKAMEYVFIAADICLIGKSSTLKLARTDFNKLTRI